MITLSYIQAVGWVIIISSIMFLIGVFVGEIDDKE